jgi:hypothetical protein
MAFDQNERVSAADGGRPYLIVDVTLDDCIRHFMTKPAGQHQLYEIQSAPQGELDDRFYEIGIEEPSIHGTGRMLVDSWFENG